MSKSFSSTVWGDFKALQLKPKRIAKDSWDLISLAPETDAGELWITVEFNGIDEVRHIDPNAMSTVDLRVWKKKSFNKAEYPYILSALNLENLNDSFGAYCLDEETGFIELRYSLPHEVMDLIDFGGLIIELTCRYAGFYNGFQDEATDAADERA